MEKETVIEIEFLPIWDKWAWRITKQNETIFKRGEFKDDNISVRSVYFPDFNEDEKFLFIKGNSKHMDDKINICTTEEKEIIEKKVKAINEKYGIKKRWRAKDKESYYLMLTDFSIVKDGERYTTVDDKRYKFGNYLKTEEEALEYAEHMKKCSLEWHEKRDNDY